MSTITPFLSVSEHVACNPVARAVSAARLQAGVRDFRATRLALLLDGDDASGDVHVCVTLLTVCILAMDLAGHAEHDGVPQMREAKRLLIECAKRGGKWQVADTPAVDEALLCAMDLYPQLGAQPVRDAWARIHRVEGATA